MTKYIIYYRVSTAKQGKSGLGLEAQQSSTRNYIKSVNGVELESYTDIESGSKDNRPKLSEALRKCRLTGATLLIAKLDRLSRNRSFLMKLQDSSVKFVCSDMPEANNFTIGLMACMADYERELISERTKAALKAAKARGVKLGNPNLDKVRNTNTANANQARITRAKSRKDELKQVINEIKSEFKEKLSLRQIADKLNSAGYTTARGVSFHATSVSRVLAS